MAKIKQELWRTLQNLTKKEFKTFKWFLEQDDILQDFSGIPVAQLEYANREDIVDLMVHRYQGPGALKRTMGILERMGRNDLKQRLHNFSLDPEDDDTERHHFTPSSGVSLFCISPKLNQQFTLCNDNGRYLVPPSISPVNYPPKFIHALNVDHRRNKTKLKKIQQFAVEVTLNPRTAHPNLILSGDGKRVRLNQTDDRRTLQYSVLGTPGFSSGRFYYEVQVKAKTSWTVGVAKESADRREDVIQSPENGFWILQMRNVDKYYTHANPPVHLSLKSSPKKVGVFLDCEKRRVSFYDVDTADRLFSFTDCSFTEILYPFFSPGLNTDGGRNSSPLIICSVAPDKSLFSCCTLL